MRLEQLKGDYPSWLRPSRKHLTRLERLARDKLTSMLRKFVTYSCKKLYDIGSRWKFHNIICLLVVAVAK